MKFVAKLRTLGGSLGFSVPYEVIEGYELKEGDYVDVEMNKCK